MNSETAKLGRWAQPPTGLGSKLICSQGDPAGDLSHAAAPGSLEVDGHTQVHPGDQGASRQSVFQAMRRFKTMLGHNFNEEDSLCGFLPTDNILFYQLKVVS